MPTCLHKTSGHFFIALFLFHKFPYSILDFFSFFVPRYNKRRIPRGFPQH